MERTCPRAQRNTASALLALFFSAILVIGLAPVPSASAEPAERGPEAPAIENEFATFDTAGSLSHTVTLRPNGGSGTPVTMATDTGTITLPSAEDVGFAAPANSQFVGWSTDKSGRENVYSKDVLFPDNASHTAALDRDATLYAIWLPDGVSSGNVTAYFYIRTDGTIPFEPSQGQKSSYLPRGSGTQLAGSLRQPVAVTNDAELVEANLQTIPSDQQIAEQVAAAKLSGVSFDPATQKIVWYVIKSRYSGGGAWNVDGVIVPLKSYMVYYNPNGGDSNVPSAASAKEDSTVTVDFATIPDRPGYEFLGWADSPSAATPDYPLPAKGEAAGTFTMPEADKHLFAVWKPSFVDVTYVAEPANGGTLTHAANTVRSYDGNGITGSQATPAKGWLFAGWHKGASLVTPNTDLDVTAVMNTANRVKGAFAPTRYVARFEQAAPALTAVKSVTQPPANGEFFVEGEEVRYQVDVTNSGNTALLSITVDDSQSGLHQLGSLAPGQSTSVAYTHTVTAADVAQGYVINQAAVNAKAYDGRNEAVPVPEQVVGAAVRTGALPPDETYVLYGAYPADAGSIGKNYQIVDVDTAAGLTDRTAVAQAGFTFAGWYEGDELVSTQPTLTASEMRDVLNRLDAEGKRAVYAPTLFIAHFVAEEPDPDNPDDPNKPDVPDTPNPPVGPDDPDGPDNPNQPGGGTDEPTQPDQPGTPSQPGGTDKPVVPDEPGAGDEPDDSGNAEKPGQPTAPDQGQGSGSKPVTDGVGGTHLGDAADATGGNDTQQSSNLAKTGDDALKAELALGGAALLAGLALALALAARRRAGDDADDENARA